MEQFNGLWVFCGFCVFMSFVHKWVAMRLKNRRDDTAVVQRYDGITARVHSLEERVANLETVILETEKHRRFDQELTAAGNRGASQTERSRVQ